LGGAGPTDLKGPLGLGVGVLLAGLLLVQLLVLRQAAAAGAGGTVRPAAEQGMIPPVARLLFTAYLVPFEITSMLLLAALVGAVVLAQRKLGCSSDPPSPSRRCCSPLACLACCSARTPS